MALEIYLYVVIFLLFMVLAILFMAFKKLKLKNNQLSTTIKSTNKEFQLSQEFIAQVSQELRTPLYGIMGLTNLLSEQSEAMAHSKHLKSLKFTSSYLFNLINNVLHVNFLNSNKIELNKKSTPIKEVIHEIVNSFNYVGVTKNNTIHLEIDPSLPEHLITDKSMISQVLMNLINNALRFTRNGNVYIHVENAKQENSTYTLVFKVSHDGNDLSKEAEKTLYEEFSDLDTAKYAYLGTGLNATIVNKLVDTLNGEIMVNQDEISGSEYAFIVPMEALEAEPRQITDLTNRSSKVLIVDDNRLNLLVAEKIMASEGFVCTTIDNGFDAISLVKENKYDLVLMDINMPKLNGIGTTKRIREFDKDTPIIALTAVDVTQLNRQIIGAGFNDYILKPYDRNLLIEIVHKQLQREPMLVS
ncbi:response regulator [Aquimarina sp. ERC-38]|uniref:response regulator n=1 Tax=Aquimarina sp. ERC-38 TaxID=2949996 RepID=UPI002248629A|nr:response regulator [Aquimarina sp. ERC-38]UZO79821.1 response regulator [Aquimarina sp. ERC-38]